MRKRQNIPVAALRAFEAAARHGRLGAAADELSVTHGAISRHVSNLESFIGVPLFEGPRNRPRLTEEGRLFGYALTAAFDQIEDAMRLIARGSSTVLDVGCLSTFAMRWLIPRLHDFSAKFPQFDVRLATDDRPLRTPVDVQITVLPGEAPLPEHGAILFEEHLGMVAAPSALAGAGSNRMDAIAALPRLETRTRPHVWQEWFRLSGDATPQGPSATRVFDHYHLTIEAALNGLGAAIVPWHLISEEVERGRLIAPSGFLTSGQHYVVIPKRPGERKAISFVSWLKAEAETASQPASDTCGS